MGETNYKTFAFVGGNAHGKTFKSDGNHKEIVMLDSRYRLETYVYRKGREIRRWKVFISKPVHWLDINQALLNAGLFDDCEKQILSDEDIKMSHQIYNI